MKTPKKEENSAHSVTIRDKELNELFLRILPPEEFGEDSNVEELYNRIIDLETKSLQPSVTEESQEEFGIKLLRWFEHEKDRGLDATEGYDDLVKRFLETRKPKTR